jgi:hypothetical protein
MAEFEFETEIEIENSDGSIDTINNVFVEISLSKLDRGDRFQPPSREVEFFKVTCLDESHQGEDITNHFEVADFDNQMEDI